ncbi:MAG: C40 family peptidase [Burkholderiales bacterium]|nr:C40 family peptidase [Burkholderiales bacterium]
MPSTTDPQRPPAGRRARRLRRAVFALAIGIAMGATGVVHAAESRGFGVAATEAAGKVLSGAQDVAVYALSLIGVKYKFGGNTPASGLDCSGLVRYVFQEVTGVTLPRTSRELSGVGDKVRIADLVPGDLVFFNTRRFPNSHVGIYLGDDRFIHAPSRGGDVEIATLSTSYWRKRFDGARRLVQALPSLAPELVASAHAASMPDPTTPATTATATTTATGRMLPDPSAPPTLEPTEATP